MFVVKPFPYFEYDEEKIMLKVPHYPNQDFYLAYSDFLNRFCVKPLRAGEEYSIPTASSRLLSVPSYIPKHPFVLRKVILYYKYLPTFFDSC